MQDTSAPVFVAPLSTLYVTSESGPRDVKVGSKTHYGVDLRGSSADEVFSAADGVVVRANHHETFGNLVVLDHGNGYHTLYAHLDSIRVKLGDSQGAGSPIGIVGKTGTASGPHLHFSILKLPEGAGVNADGKLGLAESSFAIDPRPLVPSIAEAYAKQGLDFEYPALHPPVGPPPRAPSFAPSSKQNGIHVHDKGSSSRGASEPSDAQSTGGGERKSSQDASKGSRSGDGEHRNNALESWALEQEKRRVEVEAQHKRELERLAEQMRQQQAREQEERARLEQRRREQQERQRQQEEWQAKQRRREEQERQRQEEERRRQEMERQRQEEERRRREEERQAEQRRQEEAERQRWQRDWDLKEADRQREQMRERQEADRQREQERERQETERRRQDEDQRLRADQERREREDAERRAREAQESEGDNSGPYMPLR